MDGVKTPVYRPDIDGLRAVAVLLVVVYHAFPGRLTGGFIGVDVFFVISGYLISSLILSALIADRFTLKEFYARRIRRIFPALAVAMALTLIVSWFILRPDELAQLGAHTVAGAGFVANVKLWADSGYFDVGAQYKPLLHLWSLGVEEQFYIAWPLMLVVVWRFRRDWLWPFIGVTAFISFITNIWLTYTSPAAAFYLPVTRFWELLVGCAIAYAELTGRTITTRDFSWLGLLLIIAGAALINGNTGFPGWWALLPTLGTTLLISGGAEAAVNRRFLTRLPVVFVGLISYPLYLFHWPLLSLLHTLNDGAYFAGNIPRERVFRMAAIVIAFVLSVLTFVLIERPIRSGSRRRLALVTSIVMLASIGGAGIIVKYRQGFPSRFGHAIVTPTNQWSMNVVHGFDDDSLARAIIKERPSPERDFFDEDPAQTTGRIAVLGDSHAARLAVGVASVIGRERVISAGRSSCLPLLNADNQPGCQPMINQMLSFVAQRPDVRWVVLTGFFSTHFDGRKPWRGDVRFEDAMRSTVAYMLAHRKRVIIALDVPELNRTCQRREIPVWDSHAADCDLPSIEHKLAQALYVPRIKTSLANMPDVQIFDPATVLCDRVVCHATLDHQPLYFVDGHHLSSEGAELVARAMLHATGASGSALK